MNWRDYVRETWRTLPPAMRRLALGALIPGVGLLVLSFLLPPGLQLWTVVGLFALFVVVQAAILWQMWRQRPAVRKARKLFRSGDYEGVVGLLESEYLEGKGDAIGDTLLGNAYRQLGRLEESERVLTEACAVGPDMPFAAYGLGRTLLAMGCFAEAAEQIDRAIECRGLPVIHSELALAHYYAGAQEAVVAALQRVADLAMEPHRMLMTAYLGGQTGQLTEVRVREATLRHAVGLPYWQAEARLFPDTPYGSALAQDVARIEAMLDDTAGEE
jgi:tetratricopeptide (TPR) repeat protein